ncbi:MAG: hypothetical protein A2653_02885 [Candidatus Zambryskibacteria bacterium RIFCSPHIGHO2_01_FULL_43_25]|uniref:Uncharacterized protein n=1 Tax=Candidatus Zambryskibacteria bacterium RIFCSPLOWO2_01_FULL_45_21 TaxID=1802761 RepID=A0A1G2U0F6_9BACT|nr:MAG: hypothetical protein A2653_02885 [Candidatus Zambryskibacteria bacterium RIFCSPHIGHO2_01_FULL_43_25]OHB00925.1 MAG: hypothetical protein A3E94_00085 [Candidatus Zambryskibacteria bacterium RIFCSPHIGHO2_12_FULL_44_12b]OHB02953.1 MAG: hypothetical protein A3B14_00730 [Candidatus Zambryskibacteria bacterium RIFCSPLOWO2_01_FULL_45_21]
MKKVLSTIALYALPFMALAGGPQLTNVEDFFQSIGRIIEVLLPIVVALALLFFFWGLAKYILAAGDEEKKKEGKNIMIWGIVALFVMVAVWGLVEFIGEALDVNIGDDLSNVPGVPGLP